MTGERRREAGRGPTRGLREGRALLVAGLVSTLGDALAGVAASFLINARTGSPGLTALTLAASFLPGLAGGLGLGGLGDRLPRREVCIVCELLSVPVVLGTVISGMPALAIIGLIAVIELINQPFSAARTALVTEVVPPERLARFIGLDRTGTQLCLFLGVILGAAAVGVLGAETALVLDAGTFALSALMIVVVVRGRSRPSSAQGVALVGGAREGWRNIRASPLALRAVVVTWASAGIGIVLEGLAIPLARDYSGDVAESTDTTDLVVLFLGSLAGMAVVGAFVGSWLSRRRQQSLLVPLALVASAPGILLVIRPPELVVVAVYAITGLSAVAGLFGQILFSTTIPDSSFSRSMGVAAGGVAFAQGLALSLAAGCVEIFDVQDVIAAASGIVTLLVLVAAAATRLGRDEPGRPAIEQEQRVEVVMADPQPPVQARGIATAGVPSQQEPDGSSPGHNVSPVDQGGDGFVRRAQPVTVVDADHAHPGHPPGEAHSAGPR